MGADSAPRYQVRVDPTRRSFGGRGDGKRVCCRDRRWAGRRREGAGAPGGEQGFQGGGELTQLRPEQNHRGPVAERSPAQGDFKLREEACPYVHGYRYMVKLDVLQGKNVDCAIFF